MNNYIYFMKNPDYKDKVDWDYFTSLERYRVYKTTSMSVQTYNKMFPNKIKILSNVELLVYTKGKIDDIVELGR
jgi:hypothetical protein